jgi:5-methylcytosine-specific restriction endonuclease McrA
MILLFQDKCRVVDNDYVQYDYKLWIEYTQDKLENEYFYISTVQHRLAIPHVVVLTAYDKLPRNQVKYSRESVFQRDKFLCAYCGKKFKKQQLTIDHINPKAYGGTKSWKNTISSCMTCNAKKADRTPEEAHMPLLFEPTEPSWFQQIKDLSEHIYIKEQWKPFIDSFVVKAQ